MRKRIRVLFILPSLGQGGAETQLVSLVNGLSPEYFEKHLVCFEKQQELLDQVNQEEVVFKYISRRKKFDPKLSQSISEYIDQHNFDVVHATLLISAYFAWNALRHSKTRCPLIIAVHSTKSRSWRVELAWRTLFQRAFRGATKLTFVSNNQKALWMSRFSWMAAKSVTIHNGIETDNFIKEHYLQRGAELRQQLAIDDDMPIISCIAAFRTEKNHLVLLQAMKHHGGEFILCLAGDGDLRAQLEQQVETLGLKERVRFLGRIEDVRPLLAISSFTVMASKSEAFSMAMLESLAMKVPMLATDVGGMSEAIVPFETGVLVEPSNVESLALGIGQMFSNKDRLKTMGDAGAALVCDHFTRQAMLDKTAQLLLDVAGSNAIS